MHSMRSAIAILAATFTVACSAVPVDVDPASDAPVPSSRAKHPYPVTRSHAQALATWQTPEDVNAWIGAQFIYDHDRALLLSESQRAGGQSPAIYEPSEFFSRPEGVCVDLARFAVETLSTLAPGLNPRYLMVEFSPVLRAGQVLRRHWIASFERDGGYYFFADSKYPGKISGPYPSVQAFITEYAVVRQREVVAFKQLDSYSRQPKLQKRRRNADA